VDAWDDTEAGFRGGYKSGKQRGAVRVYFDGGENMGIHVVVPGQGCRQLEVEGVLGEACPDLGQVGGWRGFLGDLRGWGAKFSRFDLAADDKQGVLDLEALRAAVEQKCVVSKFEVASPDWAYSLDTGEVTGRTMYFGHPSSDFRVRLYDKRLERIQAVRGLKPDEQAQRLADLPESWGRAELQSRRRHANALVDAFVEKGAVAVAELLSSYIDVKEQGTGDLAHRYRWHTCQWWLTFLGLVERAKDVTLSLPKLVENTLQTVKHNLIKQWGAWIGAIQMADGFEVLADIAKLGKERMHASKKSDKYLRFVRDYWRYVEDSGLGDPFELALLGRRERYAL
jgi:phage replication initiation protein